MILCNLMSLTETISEFVIAVVTTFSLLFALYAFRKDYKVSGNYEYDDSSKGRLIINFVNKSRINTSVLFLGVFLHENNLIRDENNRIESRAGFPHDIKGDYNKYVYGLTNLHPHNSLTIKIPIDDIIKQINSDSYWNKQILNDIHKQKINLIFAFVDYDDKMEKDTLILTPTNQYKYLYNIIKNNTEKTMSSK